MNYTVILSSLTLLGLIGCETAQQGGTAMGAGAGAIVGAVAGHNIEGISKAEGAVAGAVIGGIAGNMHGKQQDQINSMRAEIDASKQTVVHVQNSNGSTIPVIMTRSGDGWIGPRGEYYASLPGSSQLRPIYGF